MPPAPSSRRPVARHCSIYPGDQHYFSDSSLPSYEPNAAALLTRRVLDFLATR
jgi:hypothetical protein